MEISILCNQGCQFRDLDFNNNRNIGHIDKRKIQEASMTFFLFAKEMFFVQFHVNLKLIRVNFIDFNCYYH